MRGLWLKCGWYARSGIREQLKRTNQSPAYHVACGVTGRRANGYTHGATETIWRGTPHPQKTRLGSPPSGDVASAEVLDDF